MEQHSKIVLALLFVLCASITLADTATQTATLNIVCNGEAQCVTVVNGTPVIFSGNGSSVTLNIPVTFTYERNVTYVQNVTVNQTTTVVNVTTTNVTVVDCNMTGVDQATMEQNIINSLSSSLTSSCSQACTASDAVRTDLQQRLSACEINLANATVQCEAQYLAVQAQCSADLNISRQETQQARETNTPWMLITVLMILAVGVYAWSEYTKSKPQKVPGGPTVRTLPPEMLDEDEFGDEPPEQVKPRGKRR